jgi:hypothetical protein
MYYFFYGFMDDGESWTLGRAVFKHNGFDKYISNKTSILMNNWMYYANQKDPMGFAWVLKDYFYERMTHAL